MTIYYSVSQQHRRFMSCPDHNENATVSAKNTPVSCPDHNDNITVSPSNMCTCSVSPYRTAMITLQCPPRAHLSHALSGAQRQHYRVFRQHVYLFHVLFVYNHSDNTIVSPKSTSVSCPVRTTMTTSRCLPTTCVPVSCPVCI